MGKQAISDTLKFTAVEKDPLPCPLCGEDIGEPIAKKWNTALGEDTYSYSAVMRCENCNLTIATKRIDYETEEAAKADLISVWNSRAKAVC